MNLDKKYADKIITQSYASKQAIDGVELVEGQVFADDSGYFAELFRFDSGSQIKGLAQPFAVAQMSCSLMMPGSIKAFHLHFEQDDVWFVAPSHQLLVNLHDMRENSPTFDQHQRFVMGAGKNSSLRIPAGVAHGAANLYPSPMMLLYATSQQFNPEKPDEHRLPWDIFGKKIWEMTKG